MVIGPVLMIKRKPKVNKVIGAVKPSPFRLEVGPDQVRFAVDF